MPANPFPFRPSASPRCLKIILVMAALTMAVSCPAVAQDTEETVEPSSRSSASIKLLATLGPEEKLGAWSVAPLPSEADRMQAVHATLLPSGKILIVNGSSLRVQTRNFPGVPFKLVDNKSYQVTDNTGLFDPGVYNPDANSNRSKFTKIDSPANPIDGKGNDLFCNGHLQTPNGDVLFVSGTDNYFAWSGTVLANLFDWKTETWKKGGNLKDGHWYPTLLPLANGQIAAISGWSVVPGRMSTRMEFYDWTKPAASAWKTVNIADLPNGPFTAPDSLDHYPRILALHQEGQFLITGDGSGGGNEKLHRTYFMTITPGATASAAPNVSFERAADRPSPRRIYSTATVDPNSPHGDVLLIGGQLGTEGAMIGPTDPPKDPTQAVTTQMERFTPPTSDHPKGKWEATSDFIGDRLTDARSNHFATILPTKQLLIMGGGMYRFYSPNFQPLLLTPNSSAPGGYQRVAMNPGTQARLYHNTTLLLPDGRIFVAGGNASLAVLDPQDDGFDVLLNTHYKSSGLIPLDYVEKGTYAISAEIYQIEFFYPPYLFLPGPRPEITKYPTSITYGTSHTLSVSHMKSTASLVLMKLGAATHGWDMGQRLVDLEFSQDLANGQVTFKAPSASDRHLSPPAYYMLFYVNDIGYPSIAKIIQLQP